MAVVTRRRGVRVLVVVAAAFPLLLAGGAALLTVVIGGTCTGSGVADAPSALAIRDIPASFLRIYEQVGAQFKIPWEVLAGIGQEECDQGRLPDPSCTPQPGATGPGVVAGRAGRRQDPDADPPCGVSACERPRAAVGDPRGHVQRPRRRRVAAAARRPAGRDRRACRYGGDVPFGVRAAVARARGRVRAHRALHDLRPGGHAPGGRLAALRRRARGHPAGCRRLWAARERRGARRDLARQERAAVPG